MNSNNNIYRKLYSIQNSVKELVRTEENKFQNYHFFNEFQVLKVLKTLLKEHKLLILLSDETTQPFIHEKSDSSREHFVKYLKKMEIIDIEENEKNDVLTYYFWACGNNTDLAKAKGASETYAIKYCLSKFFLIPVKDENDPDYSNSNKDVSEEKKKVEEFFKKHHWSK